MQHADIVHRCFRCGYCKLPTQYQDFNCPPYRQFGFDTYAAGGRMWLINAWLKGEIDAGERLAHILFSCVACGNCAEQCIFTFKEYLPEVFVAALTPDHNAPYRLVSPPGRIGTILRLTNSLSVSKSQT